MFHVSIHTLYLLPNAEMKLTSFSGVVNGLPCDTYIKVINSPFWEGKAFLQYGLYFRYSKVKHAVPVEQKKAGFQLPSTFPPFQTSGLCDPLLWTLFWTQHLTAFDWPVKGTRKLNKKQEEIGNEYDNRVYKEIWKED